MPHLLGGVVKKNFWFEIKSNIITKDKKHEEKRRGQRENKRGKTQGKLANLFMNVFFIFAKDKERKIDTVDRRKLVYKL